MLVSMLIDLMRSIPTETIEQQEEKRMKKKKKKFSTIKKRISCFTKQSIINNETTQKCLQKRKFQLCFHRDSNRIRKTLETVLETLRYLNLSRNLPTKKNKHHTFELKSISFN